MEPLLQVCDFWNYPDRYSIVNSWWDSHGMEGNFPENTIPKLAIIVTADGVPQCFLACDMSNSTGKAYLETALTAPGLSPASARRALQFAEVAIFSVLKELQYGLAQIYTSPAVARTLVRNGWASQGEVIHLIKPIT